MSDDVAMLLASDPIVWRRIEQFVLGGERE